MGICADALNLTETEMRHEAAVLGAMTILIGLTYLIVVHYAGVEPAFEFTARDAYVLIGAPAALVLLWLLLVGAGLRLGFRRHIPLWLSGIICIVSIVAIWFSGATATGYVNDLARKPGCSCMNAK